MCSERKPPQCHEQRCVALCQSTSPTVDRSPTSPLHSLLPPPRDQLPITRLRAASKFPRIPTRTKKVSFISLVCPSPLSDLTISSPNHYDCIVLIIVLYYYPPFASIAKGEVFVLLYVCFLPAIR